MIWKRFRDELLMKFKNNFDSRKKKICIQWLIFSNQLLFHSNEIKSLGYIWFLYIIILQWSAIIQVSLFLWRFEIIFNCIQWSNFLSSLPHLTRVIKYSLHSNFYQNHISSYIYNQYSCTCKFLILLQIFLNNFYKLHYIKIIKS